MAKRKHKKLTETQINNLLTKTVQAFHDGNLIVFYNSVTDLKRQLKVDTLKTAMHTLAMQITDEGTPTKSRFKAFEIIANLQWWEYPRKYLCGVIGDILSVNTQNYAACVKREQQTKITPKLAKAWYGYGNALVALGKCDEAIEKYERALENNPEDAKTWNNYGNALSDLGKYNEAIEKYEHALLINPEYANAWYNYGTTLSNSGKYNKAIEKYEHALEINDEDANAWNNYGNALADLGRYNEAIEKYEHARQTPDFPKYAGRIMIFLGSLYYRTKQQKKGQQCFEWLIEHVGAGDKDAVRLRTAHEILATDSENEYAIDILEQITAESPQYKESSHTLALVVSPKKFWDMFRPGSKHHLKNTQQLDHSLYHKFAGEMGLLKVIVHSIKRYSHQNGTMPTEVDEQLTNLIEQVEMMNREMLDRRQAEKTKIREIPHDNYRAMLQVISDSAHDMADFINNQLAILEADVRYILRTLPADHAYRDYFSELLTQAELTQRALNDLKAVNEGIVIRHSRFRVHDIFVKWLETPQISNAHITIDVSKNGQDMMVGDLEKIRSMLSELVNNSLKHNRDKTDLRITMTTNDAFDPPHARQKFIHNKQKYLQINFMDNGEGIAFERKYRVFLALETTSKKNKGSGLGLFIIYKTLKKMHGFIHEVGEQGVKFEIYVPYDKIEETK